MSGLRRRKRNWGNSAVRRSAVIGHSGGLLVGLIEAIRRSRGRIWLRWRKATLVVRVNSVYLTRWSRLMALGGRWYGGEDLTRGRH
jgi:hypothetical protein